MRRSILVLSGLGALLVAGVASAGDYNAVTNELASFLSAPTVLNLAHSVPAPFGALFWAGLGVGGVALLAHRRDPHAEPG
jgi:hypothetical protein